MNQADKYVDDVLKGNIPSGANLRNACKRYLEDRKNGYIWKEDEVEKVVKFIHKAKHFTGKYAGKHFRLEPWQTFIVANLYGFWNKDGFRRFQTAYLEMARKQGKTALAAILAFYHLYEEGEANPEVLLAANSKDQAHIDFRMVRGFVHSADPEGYIYKLYRNDIILRNKEGFIKTLAADSDKIDGYNCSVGIIDEFHSAPNSQVRDVIRSSQGMRDNPLLLTITTAGFDKSLPCFELHRVASEISAGIKEDESFFGLIYSLDEGDDWKDPVNWIKSNPNLGVTVDKSFLKKQVLQAINSPRDEVGVKTKNLNLWCDSATTWIPDEYIIKATRTLNRDDFAGRECFVGVDLASNRDFNAVSYLFVVDGIYYYFTDYYLPVDTISQSSQINLNKDLYRQWAGLKYLKTTPGNVTDYSYITRDLLKNNDKTPIKKIFYDKYNANQWAIQCTEAGLPLEPMSQDFGTFNRPTKEFERLMINDRPEANEHIILDDNPITRFCLRNAVIKIWLNDNIKPIRSNEKNKIDGVISMIQSLAAYLADLANYKGTAIY